MTADRIELESRLAMLERTVDALSGELIAHQQQLDALRGRFDLLLDHVRRQQHGSDPIEPHDTRPPHWGS